MFFPVSKLLGPFADPSAILMALILAGAVAAIMRRRRLASILQGIAAALIVLLGVLPGGAWLIAPLESRFPANPALPDTVAGIVALGGTERVATSRGRGQPSLSDPAPIAALIELGRRYPDAKLVFTGGSGSREEPPLTEADVVRSFLDQVGSDGNRIIYEARSRNTRENAVFTRDLIHPKPGERWILVGEAISLPRAVGAFRAVGWDMIPFPAGYSTAGTPESLWPPDLVNGLKLASVAAHEWVGLAVYWALGYTSEIFPN